MELHRQQESLDQQVLLVLEEGFRRVRSTDACVKRNAGPPRRTRISWRHSFCSSSEAAPRTNAARADIYCMEEPRLRRHGRRAPGRISYRPIHPCLDIPIFFTAAALPSSPRTRRMRRCSVQCCADLSLMSSMFLRTCVLHGPPRAPCSLYICVLRGPPRTSLFSYILAPCAHLCGCLVVATVGSVLVRSQPSRR
jgi:hypothetical protein